MTVQRLSRFLPSRSQLLLIAALTLLAVSIAGFVDLALTRRATLLRWDAARTVVARQQAQQARLQLELEQAQLGEQITQRAWEYFGLTGSGIGVIRRAADGQP